MMFLLLITHFVYESKIEKIFKNIFSIIIDLIRYLDSHQAILTIILTFFGWLVLLFMGIYHSKKSLKNEAKLKIYEEIMNFKKKIDKSFSIDLAIKLSPHSIQAVLNDMENFENGNLNLIFGEKLEKSYLYWDRYIREIINSITNSHEDLLNYYTYLESWLGVIPNLKPVRDMWFNELKELYTKLWDFNSICISSPLGDPIGWKESLLIKAETIISEINEFTGYTEDLNILLHDELISPIFGYKKRERDLSHVKSDISYTTLTKNGFVKKKHFH